MKNKNFFIKILSDKMYIKLMYHKRLKKKLNLKNPQTFNEKLQWLKLYDRNPKYTQMVDKYEAKKYVSNIADDNGQRSQLSWDNPAEDTFDLLKDIYKLDKNEYLKTKEYLVDLLNISEIIKKPVRTLS